MSTTSRPQRWQHPFWKLLLLGGGLGFGLLLALVLSDIWMDWREYQQGWVAWRGKNQRRLQLTPDPHLGFRFRSNLRNSRFHWGSYKLQETVNTDKHGFRNAGKLYWKAEVAVIGDSIMEPLFVNEPDSAFRVMERKIRRSTVAFAVARWNLAHYNAAIQHKVLPHSSIRTVILGLYHNDVQNYESFAQIQNDWKTTIAKRRLHLQEPIPGPRFGFHCLFQFCLLKETFSRWSKPNCRSTSLRVGKDILTDIRPHPWSGEQMEDTLRMISLAHRQLHKAWPPRRLVVMWLPSQAALYRKEIDSRCPGKGTGVWNKEQQFFGKLRKLSQKKGFVLWDSRSMLLKHKNKGEQLFWSEDVDHHFNIQGNRRLGEWMAQKVKPLLPHKIPHIPPWVTPRVQRHLQTGKR